MLVSVEWLNGLLKTPQSTEDIVDALNRAGVEIEDVITPPNFHKDMVVGLIDKVFPHPDADKLRLAAVTDGKNEYQVICGAPNIEAGQKVPFARVGAVLPDGMKIKQAKIRGVNSYGMLCSQRELGLGTDHEGIHILDAGACAGDWLGNIVDSSDLIDVTTAANRADLQSILGLAREVAVHTGTTLTGELKPHALNSTSGLLGDINKTAVHRFTLTEIELHDVSMTPEAMRSRLEAIGGGLHGMVVDTTNFIMHEYGQPMHAFDADTIVGKVGVRFAKVNETLITLDGIERTLTKEDLVVVDDAGPIALAGVIGGQRTEVSLTTKNILLECAVFDGAIVRRSSIRHGIRTDASARFERGLPVELPSYALERAHFLLNQNGHISIKNHQNIVNLTTKTSKIAVSVEQFSSLAGFSINRADFDKQLQKLGFDMSGGKETINIVVPFWRQDVSVPQDVFEEVIKIVGVDNVPSTIPSLNADPGNSTVDLFWLELRKLRYILRGLGFTEVNTYPFISQDQVAYDLNATHLTLKNPRSIEQSYMRRSTLPSHIAILERHLHNDSEVKLFETYRNFYDESEPSKLSCFIRATEDVHLRIARIFDEIKQKYQVNVDLRTTSPQGALLQNQTYFVYINNIKAGLVGMVRPDILMKHKISGEIAFLEIDLNHLFTQQEEVHSVARSRNQSGYRDISLEVASDVLWLDVQKALPQFAPKFIDEYIVGNKKVLTARVEVAKVDRAPTQDEIDALTNRVRKLLKSKLNAHIQD